VNKNAFIWTAIWGDNFLVATCSAWQLIWSNLARVYTLNAVSGFLMLLGRVLVAVATAGVSGFIMSSVYGPSLNSLAMPVFVVFVVAFSVVSMVVVTVETTVDAVFLCFLVDDLVNGSTDQSYAPKRLRDIVHKHGEISAKFAAEVSFIHYHKFFVFCIAFM